MPETILFLISVVSVIIFIVISVLIHKIKKQSLDITISINDIESEARKMLFFFNTRSDAIIKKSKQNSYYYKTREINYKLDPKHIFLTLITLYHEVGHHLMFKPCLKIALRIIAVNRIIVIPIYILSLIFQKQINSILLPVILFVYIITASLIRLTAGMIFEYQASKKSLEYINSYYNDDKITLISKRFYRLDFIMQFQVVLFVFSLLFIFLLAI